MTSININCQVILTFACTTTHIFAYLLEDSNDGAKKCIYLVSFCLVGLLKNTCRLQYNTKYFPRGDLSFNLSKVAFRISMIALPCMKPDIMAPTPHNRKFLLCAYYVPASRPIPCQGTRGQNRSP